MSTTAVESFFDQTGGGAGAPSIKMSALHDGVIGEILEQTLVPCYEFGTKNQKTDKKTGKPVEQLQVIVQTDLKNWDRVAKVPLVNHEDPTSGPKPASEDDGKRAIYIEPWTNIHAAVGAAVAKATGVKGPLLNGGRLGIKVAELKDTGKGNPLKIHEAVYTPPVASGNDFFAGGSNDAAPATQSAPATSAAPANEVSEPPF